MLTISPYSNKHTNINFGTKIPTRDAISLATQRHLSNDFKDILEATDKITERKNSIHDLVACGDKCKEALLTQFPVLKEVAKNTEKFFKNKTRSSKETDAFVEKQIELVGAKELDVQPIKIDDKVYYQFNKKIADKKPVIAFIHK